MDPVLREASRILRLADALLHEDEDDEDDGVPFRHILSPPEEFRTPDLSRVKRLDREQELQGLDAHRRAEDVEPLGEMTVRRGCHGR